MLGRGCRFYQLVEEARYTRSVLSEKQEALNTGRAKSALSREDILEISRHKMKDVSAIQLLDVCAPHAKLYVLSGSSHVVPRRDDTTLMWISPPELR
jgi:hypothetical protein